MELQKPTRELVIEYIERFDKEQQRTEEYIDKLIAKYPQNTSYDEILEKVIAINSLYSTNVKNVFDMASNIINIPNVDDILNSSDLHLVCYIAHLTGEEYGKNGARYYSFATKYCNWHSKSVYPIYDSNADIALKSLRDDWKLIKFEDDALHFNYYGYGAYKDLIVRLANYYEISDNNPIKQIDKFLWLYGKQVSKCKEKKGKRKRDIPTI